MQKYWQKIIVLLVSGLPAIYFTRFLIADSLQLLRAQAWAQASAEIHVADADSLPEDDGTGHGPGANFERIEYRFTVGGAEYISRRYGPFQRWNFGKNAIRFQKGASVTAWFNPKNPHESVLDRTVRSGLATVALISGLLLIWFLYGVLWVIYGKRWLRPFAGHILLILPISIGIGALIASDVERTLDWWLAVGGFLGAIAAVGIGITLSTWFGWARYVAVFGMVGGFVTLLVGAVLK